MDSFSKAKVLSIKDCVRFIGAKPSTEQERRLAYDARQALQKLLTYLEARRATPHESKEINKGHFIAKLAASGVPIKEASELWESFF